MELPLPGGFDHPSWLTGVATAVAYGVLLTAIFLALFVVPYVAFRAL